MIPFVDCQGLGGGWTLGAVRTGRLRLAHRVSMPGGFGDEAVEANRALLPGDWAQETCEPAEWTPWAGVGAILGTPPCSAFSTANRDGRLQRGQDSPINQCMTELVRYGAMCVGTDGRQGAEVISLESVQGAHRHGRPMFQGLLERLRRFGPYELTHVLLSAASVGGAQVRERYYAVFHRVPFGLEMPERRERPVTVRDAIGDLEGQPIGWDRAEYASGAFTGFQEAARRGSPGLSQHAAGASRLEPLFRELDGLGWPSGEKLPEACARHGVRPRVIEHRYRPDAKANTGGYTGFNWPKRVHADRPGYALVADSVNRLVHYGEPRFLTVRELSRLMGYPDAWTWPTRSASQASAWIGKCCPVSSGEWVANWIAAALEGYPGPEAAVAGEHERVFDCTRYWKEWT